MSENNVDHDSLIKSYRYLRIGMVGLLACLGISVAYQTHKQGWDPLSSISEYYYTPTQAVFVGVLISVGVCMIIIKGTRDDEDVLLNIAGMLAPVVALVPPSRGEDFDRLLRDCRTGDIPVLAARVIREDCPSVEAVQAATEANVQNNVFAFLAVGALGLGAALYFASRDGKIDKLSKVGLALAAVVYLVCAGGYFGYQDGFIRGAHYPAAILMFVCIVGVAISNATRNQQKQGKRERLADHSSLARTVRNVLGTLLRPRDAYSWIALAMVLAGCGGICLELIAPRPPEDTIFWTEAALIALFAIFWAIQTSELWKAEHALAGAAAGQPVDPPTRG